MIPAAANLPMYSMLPLALRWPAARQKHVETLFEVLKADKEAVHSFQRFNFL